MLRRMLIGLFTVMALVLLNDICIAAEMNEEWNPPSAGPVTTWTAPLCGKGKFAIQPFFFYNRTRGFFDSDGHYESLPDSDWKNQFQEQLFAQFGLTDRIDMSTKRQPQSRAPDFSARSTE